MPSCGKAQPGIRQKLKDLSPVLNALLCCVSMPKIQSQNQFTLLSLMIPISFCLPLLMPTKATASTLSQHSSAALPCKDFHPNDFLDMLSVLLKRPKSEIPFLAHIRILKLKYYLHIIIISMPWGKCYLNSS